MNRLKEVPRTAIGVEELFQHVTEEYQRGELTLGEAAELLGMNRHEYDARLKELGIVQERIARTAGDVTLAQKLIEELRKE